MERALALARVGLVALVAAGCNREGLDAVPDGFTDGGGGPDAGAAIDLAGATSPDLAYVLGCRTVEVSYGAGADGLQIAVWIEEEGGKFIDTVSVTRVTGFYGLGNRPGEALLKTDFGWPYGRREMVLPVWAHRRNHHYPKLVMGGACGNSPATECPDGKLCGADCDDTTIAYHSRVSSAESFYCSPSGASKVDAMTCASRGTFSKGAFAGGGEFSLYPPRADLIAFSPQVDSPDIKAMAQMNDLVAISQATPRKGVGFPPILWVGDKIPDGDYVAWIEASQESDWNASHHHPNRVDTVQAWAFEGHDFLGQPSVVYRVPFHLDGRGTSTKAVEVAGYSKWDGSDGVLYPLDGTITVGVDGTGAGRLGGVQVRVGGCAL